VPFCLLGFKGFSSVLLLVLLISLCSTVTPANQVKPGTNPPGLEEDRLSPISCPAQPESPLSAVPQILEIDPHAELWFDPDVVAGDRVRLKEGLQAAESYIQSVLNESLPPLTCFYIRATDAGPAGSAETEGNRVLIFTGLEGWPGNASWNLQEVAAHEYGHVWEFSVVGEFYSSSPVWLMEGIAEWTAFQAMIAAGIMTSGDVEVAIPPPTGPLVPPLERLEAPDGWSETLQAYNMGFRAVALLTSAKGSGALSHYLEEVAQGRHWQEAFFDTFGLQPTDLYAIFDAQRP
jgi:hypothetical protein